MKNHNPEAEKLQELESIIEKSINNVAKMPEAEYRLGLQMFSEQFPDFPFMIEVFEQRRREWISTQN